MTVPTLITDLSTTAASNSPSGSDAVFPDLDNFIRAYGAFIAQLNSLKAPIASPSFTGDSQFSGNVGIGKSPSSKLDVLGAVSFGDGTIAGSAGPGVFGAGLWGLGTTSSHPLVFGTNAAERVRIDASGNVGIGISSPSYKIQFQNATTSAGATPVFSAVLNRQASSTEALMLGVDGNTDVVIASNNSNIRLGKVVTGTFTEYFKVDTSGNASTATGKFTAGSAATAANDLPRFSQVLGGYNQAWSDVTASRALSSTYTNSTGHPIEVMVGVSSTNASPSQVVMTPTVGGVALPAAAVYSFATGYKSTCSFVVPNGATYKVDATGATLDKWCELS